MDLFCDDMIVVRNEQVYTRYLLSYILDPWLNFDMYASSNADCVMEESRIYIYLLSLSKIVHLFSLPDKSLNDEPTELRALEGVTG